MCCSTNFSIRIPYDVHSILTMYANVLKFYIIIFYDTNVLYFGFGDHVPHRVMTAILIQFMFNLKLKFLVIEQLNTQKSHFTMFKNKQHLEHVRMFICNKCLYIANAYT